MLTKLTFGAAVIVAAALMTPASAAPLSPSGAGTVATEAGKAGVVVDAHWRNHHRWWRYRYYDDDGWYYRRHHRHRWWRHHRHHRHSYY
jgi:hypothetical protein